MNNVTKKPNSLGFLKHTKDTTLDKCPTDEKKKTK